MNMQLFSHGKELYRKLDDFAPLVAQWEKSTHPVQVRLTQYQESIAQEFSPIIAERAGIGLHLQIPVNDAAKWLRQYYLENYLTPLFGTRCLDARKFALVSAEKRPGLDLRLSVGTTIPLWEPADWHHFRLPAGKAPHSD